ncbi:transglycosylase SLT domain-containing protein [Bosea sp. BK604]|uniref:transglycosylase SLT domain-containing protein n=1 Tax=Bosea sp. BK604 TaxID=2512180 RepID=UPI0010E30507|nr:transglycosylase SLT domain-containing protein [Bosea sp. BK604]TCR64796.1 sporulation related protein [Bosea sp. BK604]
MHRTLSLQMPRKPALTALCLIGLLLGGEATAAPEPASSGIDQALCRLIDGAAQEHGVPAAFLTRLIFQESSFRPGVTSPAGAQGVAQFMPGTARERGLIDPFDPEQAVPKAAHFLAELRQRFGNWGLAAAGYNGGPNRVAGWLARGGTGPLPYETENYVIAITGASAQQWAEDARAESSRDARDLPVPPRPVTPDGAASGCGSVVAAVRAGSRPSLSVAEAAFAPWGVQLAGNFSKARALATFQRAAARHRAVVGELLPMVIGTRLRSRGTRAFYRVRLPAATRAEATALCRRIQAQNGACVVLKS